MKKLILLAALVVACGCHKKGEYTPMQVAADNYEVGKLFTVDGCTVYRFYDGRFVYFTSCNGNTHWQDSCGKNCTESHDVSNEIH